MVAGAPADKSAGAFAAHTQCVSSRARSAFRRAGSLLRTVVQWTREDVPTVQWLSDFYVGALLNLQKLNRVVDHKFSVVFINIFCLRESAGRLSAVRVACSTAGTECLSSRQWFFPFWKPAGRERSCLPFRGFSFLIFRSERVLRSAHEVCSTAHTQCVLSHRWFCPFWKRAGRERSPLPFRSLSILRPLSQNQNLFFCHTQCLSPRTRSVFHRARRACLTAPVVLSVL